jgi:diguanylate cyclase
MRARKNAVERGPPETDTNLDKVLILLTFFCQMGWQDSRMNMKRRLRAIFRFRDPRRKVLLWAVLLSVFCGALELSDPLDFALQGIRNRIRSQPVSGQTVVVDIDERSAAAYGGYSVNNDINAEAIKRLNALGAAHIYFAQPINTSQSPEADQKLVAALKTTAVPVSLPVKFRVENRTGKKIPTRSASIFRAHAGEVVISTWVHPFGYSPKIPYSVEIEDQKIPSMAASIAAVNLRSNESFDVDYSYDPASIRVLSLADLISNKINKISLLGKNIVIGSLENGSQTTRLYVGYGRDSSLFLPIIGAEGLKYRAPMHAGWILSLIFSIGIATAFLFDRKRNRIMLSVSIAFFPLSFGVALLLESNGIFVQLAPSYLMLLGVIISSFWLKFGKKNSATHPVSGLPNLIGLREVGSGNEAMLALAFVRNMSQIQATLSPEDEKSLYQQIARRLSIGAFGSALYQGDDSCFGWVIEDGLDLNVGEQFEALYALFHSPVMVGTRRLDLDVCFGLDADTSRALSNRFASARIAAEQAGNLGRKWQLYDSTILEQSEWQFSLLGQLDEALSNGQMWVAYQPQLDLRTNEIVAVEALVRWTHPERGDIRPDEFVLVAEKHNRIASLTNFVLATAIEAGTKLRAAGLDIRIGVNLSGRMLDNGLVLETVLNLLAQHNLPAQNLVLELTESAAVRDNRAAMALLNNLVDLGVGISIDDYGTGYSTLGYLQDVPSQEIKIDRRFVDAITGHGSDGLLVHSTIALAHSLGRAVVAEGVETEATLQQLRMMGCDMAQGYLIAAPMPYQDLVAFLKRKPKPKRAAA